MSPLSGQPGYIVPEEELPLANHVVKVTAFQGGEQVGSGEVTVQTCKLTATSPLIRESLCECQCICVCMYVCVIHGHSKCVCVSSCELSMRSCPSHISTPLLGDQRCFCY